MDGKKGFLTQLGELLDRSRAERRVASRELESEGRTDRWRWLARQMIPNVSTLLLVTVLVLTQQVWATPLLGSINTPGPSATTVNYQGRLADSGGTPLDNTYGMSFSLWDAPSDGNLVWGPETHGAVPVSEGLFSVGLGSIDSIPTSVWNGDRYLEITVGGETLSPRELIRSVPIAGMALTVPDGAITNDKLATNAIPVYSAENTEHNWQVPQCDSTYHPIPGLTLNVIVDKPSTLLADFSGLGYNDETGKAIFTKIWVDGVGHSFLGGCRNSNVDTGSPFCGLNNMITEPIGIGQHLVEIRVQCDGGGVAKIWDGTMRAIILP